MKRFISHGEKFIGLECNQEVEVNDVYYVNILVSETLKEKKLDQIGLYQRNPHVQYQLKLKSSRTLFSEIDKKFSVFPFSLRSLQSSRLGLKECVDHGLLNVWHVTEFASPVCQMGTTVAVMSDRLHKFTREFPLQYSNRMEE